MTRMRQNKSQRAASMLFKVPLLHRNSTAIASTISSVHSIGTRIYENNKTAMPTEVIIEIE